MKRGFGSPSYSKEKHKQVASLGGFMAHQLGKAHKFNSQSGKLASKKGALVRFKIKQYSKKIDPYIALLLKLKEIK